MHAITLAVDDVARSAEFYRALLGIDASPSRRAGTCTDKNRTKIGQKSDKSQTKI